MLVGTLGAMLWLSPLLTVFTLLVIPLITLAIRTIADEQELFLSQQEAGQLNSMIEETLTGQRAG